jgi:hypothetical protein
MVANQQVSNLGLCNIKSDEINPIFSTDIKADIIGYFAKICLQGGKHNE